MAQAKRIGTFVVRYWWLSQGERRLDIEHVQSGERVCCATLSEAEAWFVAHVRDREQRGAGLSGRRGAASTQEEGTDER